MRTKTLLIAAAALAAGLASSMAQNVYSQNVVGYVNKSFTSGNFVLVCNPLQNGTNGLKQLIPNPPDNTLIFRWDASMQDFFPVIPTYSAGSGNWIPEAQIAPGEGFFVVGGGNFTNTFVGEVLQGSLSVNLIGGGNFEAIASKAPVAGQLESTILTNYPAVDNDLVFTWNAGAQDFDPVIPTWSAASQNWIPEINIGVGDAFFLVRQGGAVTWTRNFTVQ